MRINDYIQILVTLGITAMCIPFAFAANKDQFKDEFSTWLQSEKSAYQEYKDKRDAEFTSFLKTQWQEMQTFHGLVRDETPKPIKMPVAKPAPVVIPEGKKPVKIVLPEPTPSVKIKLEPVKPTPVRPGEESVSVPFYGHDLPVKYQPGLIHRLDSMDKESISNYWSQVSKADFESVLDQFKHYREKLTLNDWAYTLLINATAKQLHSNQENEQLLFTWYFLVKSGYQARIAYDKQRIFLLIPTKQQLYSTPYFVYDEKRFYAIRFDGKSQKLSNVFTYKGTYPGAVHELDLQLKKVIITQNGLKKRTLNFTYNGKKHQIDVNYDLHLVDFFETYPQTDIGLYFSANVNESVGSLLLQQLGNAVKGMSEIEAVNLLLRFVQTAFKYKTDAGQFGFENYLFLEETLYYPYSDCEDRSVLFAWLVRSLLGLQVVGLNYPGHIATAVKFSDATKGDTVTFNHVKYVVSDPTYINATAGMTMPEFKHKTPEVIQIL